VGQSREASPSLLSAAAQSARPRRRRLALNALVVCLTTLLAACSEYCGSSRDTEALATLTLGDRVLVRDRTQVKGVPAADGAATQRVLPGAPGRLEIAERATGDRAWRRVAFDEGFAGWVPETDLAPADPRALKAFPTAEGFGAAARGGRGGRVIEVTNLGDDGPGSLRAAITAKGPRTVVFRVGGTIVLRSSIEIVEPYLTIAGQTAPGGGIALRNHPANSRALIVVQTHDVVLRFLRIRPGPSAQPTCCLDALQIGRGGRRVIVDHASLSWAVDEDIDAWYDAREITLQWSIIAEALNRSSHQKGRHSRGLLFGGKFGGDYSIHHNLFAHNAQRNPLVNPGAGVADIVNNVIYDPQSRATHVADHFGRACVNYVGNLLKPGPTTNYPTLPVYALDATPAPAGGGFRLFVMGNLDELHRPSDDLPDDLVLDPADRDFVTATRVAAPLVRTTSAARALEEVLAGAGATLPARDPVDLRILHQVRTASGRMIDRPDQVGGWPALAAGTPPEDADHDGMADAWELPRGLDPQDPADRNGDRDGDGYTNLEDYLNELVGDRAP
jgi:pectate lyase